MTNVSVDRNLANTNFISVKKLEKGEWFLYGNGIWVRVYQPYTWTILCVNLESGEHVYFSEDLLVRKIVSAKISEIVI